MKIVIDIPEKWYRWAKFNDIANGSMVSKGILDAVANGTPLPKGHGRLIDADDLIQELSVVSSRPVKSQLYILREAPTIIEADTAESEE